MPPEEQCNCDICGAEDVGADVESTSQHENVCSPCRENLWDCSDCGEEHGQDDEQYSVVHGEICEDCRENGDYAHCYSCEDLLSLSRQSVYYDSDYSGEYCCEGCAGDVTIYDCDDCGCEVYFYDCGTDWYDNRQCERCYNRSAEHISRNTTRYGTNIDVSKLLLKDNYEGAPRELIRRFGIFYGRYADEYEHIPYMLNKNAFTFGKQVESEENWWHGEIKVASAVYRQGARMFSEMIQSDAFLTEHKKYGLYHPLRHLFREHIKYYNNKDRAYIEGAETSMQLLGQDYWNYRVEMVNMEGMTAMLRENKTLDGADLKRALNQIFNRAYKNRFPQFAATRTISDGHVQTAWQDIFQKYQTNTAVLKLNVQIGFDWRTCFEQFDRAEAMNSCQSPTNRDSYAFGAIDMIVNPHLLALVRNDDGEIIARSVIRLFKEDWSDAESTLYIAPSRLYLAEHTQAKNDVYWEVFRAIDRWANDTMNDYKLIAYRNSRHDQSVQSILSLSSNFKVIRKINYPYPDSIDTNIWLPWWRERPDNGEAMFTYYKDEDQRCYMKEVEGGRGIHRYAAYERLQDGEFSIIEVNNND